MILAFIVRISSDFWCIFLTLLNTFVPIFDH